MILMKMQMALMKMQMADKVGIYKYCACKSF